MATVKQAKSLALVSLFTREWIEIFVTVAFCIIATRLPLYEGVD